MPRPSLLIEGKIPVGMICPFRIRCHQAATGNCGHSGYNHNIEFSCGMARAFDIVTPPLMKIGQERK
jgi:hypothetical protein